jgi:hypothetical protein
MRTLIRAALPGVTAAVLAACSTESPQPPAQPLADFASPAGARSGEPFLSVDAANKVHFTWLEKTGDSTHAVRYARLDGESWGPVRTVAERRDFFVNWADFPAVIATPSGRLLVHWLQRSGKGRYAYGIQYAQSTDEGASWTPGRPLNSDSVEAEHGFVALWNSAGDSVEAAWLDGRHMKASPDGHGSGSMQVLSARVGADGGRGSELGIDSRSCECCQVNAAVTARGAVVVYRDRSDDEIRDIAIVRDSAGVWTAPKIVHADGWRLEGCPVNGPAIAARGDTVVVAWFTGAGDTARVRLAFSFDAGATFLAPIRVDGGAPAGRVDAKLLPTGDAVVSWLERVDSTSAEVRLRRVTSSGTAHPPVVIASTSGARASGFPKIAVRGIDILAAWTVPGDSSRIRMARLDVSAVP